jgi:hypothetical protein
MQKGKASPAPARHGLAGLGLVALLVGFGQTWSVVTLTTGSTVTLTGGDQAPLALSLLLVAGAAYALSLLLFGPGHTVTSAVQLVASGGSAAAMVASAGMVIDRASTEITRVTGLSGDGTITGLVEGVATSAFPFGLSVAGAVALALSGGVGVLIRRARVDTGFRFERRGAPGSKNPWDELSDGVDPTDL